MYDIEWHLFSSGFESENIISVMGVPAPDLVYFNSSITQGNHNLRPDKKKSTRFKTGENATKAQKQLILFLWKRHVASPGWPSPCDSTH
jgi:hypothetical protein